MSKIHIGVNNSLLIKEVSIEILFLYPDRNLCFPIKTEYIKYYCLNVGEMVTMLFTYIF